MIFSMCVTLPFGLILYCNEPFVQIDEVRLTSSALGVFCLITLMHVLTLTLAVASVCVIRRLAYAGIVSGLLSLATILIPTTVAADLNDLWDVALLSPERSEYGVFIATSGGATAAALMIAWLSLIPIPIFGSDPARHVVSRSDRIAPH